MATCHPNRRAWRARSGTSGSVLIIVLWIALGLVAITLYFANSMSSELRAADNRVAVLAADQAIEGAARYVTSVLTDQATNGIVPYVNDYANEAVLGGRTPISGSSAGTTARASPNQIAFGLVDEGSKLNLNNTEHHARDAGIAAAHDPGTRRGDH